MIIASLERTCPSSNERLRLMHPLSELVRRDSSRLLFYAKSKDKELQELRDSVQPLQVIFQKEMQAKGGEMGKEGCPSVVALTYEISARPAVFWTAIARRKQFLMRFATLGPL